MPAKKPKKRRARRPPQYVHWSPGGCYTTRPHFTVHCSEFHLRCYPGIGIDGAGVVEVIRTSGGRCNVTQFLEAARQLGKALAKWEEAHVR